LEVYYLSTFPAYSVLCNQTHPVPEPFSTPRRPRPASSHSSLPLPPSLWPRSASSLYEFLIQDISCE
jgi:hypothetical protein